MATDQVRFHFYLIDKEGKKKRTTGSIDALLFAAFCIKNGFDPSSKAGNGAFSDFVQKELEKYRKTENVSQFVSDRVLRVLRACRQSVGGD